MNNYEIERDEAIERIEKKVNSLVNLNNDHPIIPNTLRMLRDRMNKYCWSTYDFGESIL